MLTSSSNSYIGIIVGSIPIIIVIAEVVRRNYFVSNNNIDRLNKLVIITGCDSGFGHILSQQLFSLGFKVIAVCLTAEGVEKLSGKVSLATICDITKTEDIKKLKESVNRFMELNPCILWAVVNNAGIAVVGCVDWMSVDIISKIMNVNYFGMVAITKTFLPLLKQTKYSRIINISSMAGLVTSPRMAAYSASKHAVEGFSNVLRLELLPWNIFVCNINPSYMKTSMVMDAATSSLKEFRNSPTEIQEQYAYEEEIHSLNKKAADIAEDPNHVVKAMLSAILSSSPPRNIIVGKLAIFANLFYFITPHFIRDILFIYAAGAIPIMKPDGISKGRRRPT